MKQFQLLVGLSLACLILAGCKPAPPTSPVSAAPQPASKTLSPEAQAALDSLNKGCSNRTWASEIDLIERPEAYPRNRKSLGQVGGYVSDFKERLEDFGIGVKWNPEKKLYEVTTPQLRGAHDPPLVDIHQAIDLATDLLRKLHIDISKHYLDSVRFLQGLGRQRWEITWKTMIPLDGHDEVVLVYMNKWAGHVVGNVITDGR